MSKIYCILFLLFLTSFGYAGVNPRTGAFFISYTDVEFTGKIFSVDRSYSSRNNRTGLFGVGWNSKIETRLMAMPDGTICVRWWGAGQPDFFEPSVPDRQGLFLMINEIVRYQLSAGKLDNDPMAIMARKSELMASNSARAEKYFDLVEKKLLLPYKPVYRGPAKWIRNVNQVITWDGSKYTLRNWNDSWEFNNNGLPTRLEEKEELLRLKYNGMFLSGLQVGDEFSCSIATNNRGRVTGISFRDTAGLHTAAYVYDTADNLVYSKDMGGNEYRYSYDALHNLVKIGYNNNTYLQLDYDAVTNRVIKVRQPNAETAEYHYSYFYKAGGKINYLHYGTNLKKYDNTGSLMFTEYSEYESRKKPDGTEYLYRILEQSDTSYDEILYDATVENAFYRKKNGREAWAQYDHKERCSYLKIADTVYKSFYDINDNPEKFYVIDSLRKDTTTYSYVYNARNELISVKKGATLYIINGSNKDLKMEIARAGVRMFIYFKNEKPYAIQNSEWGMTLIDSVEMKKINNRNTTAEYAGTAQGREPESSKADDTGTVAKKLPGRRDAILESGSGKTNRERLLELYEEFRHVMEPKLIPHEWIWEKL